MNIFRIHIRPGGGLGDVALSVRHCIGNRLLGCGWAVDTDKALNWEEYKRQAEEVYGTKGLLIPTYMKERIAVGDLIWTRDLDGIYYLARVSVPWSYDHRQSAKDADIVNICQCHAVHRVEPVDRVPGKVVSSFRPSRTVQAIASDTVKAYSQELWNLLSQSSDFSVTTRSRALFELLDDQQVEDIVLVYLQTQGWLYVPGSRQRSTMEFEYYLIHRDTQERAVVQVKTGKTSLARDTFAGRDEKGFLFQAGGLYTGNPAPDVECLSPRGLWEFLRKNAGIFPSNISHWARRATTP